MRLFVLKKTNTQTNARPTLLKEGLQRPNQKTTAQVQLTYLFTFFNALELLSRPFPFPRLPSYRPWPFDRLMFKKLFCEKMENECANILAQLAGQVLQILYSKLEE